MGDRDSYNNIGDVSQVASGDTATDTTLALTLRGEQNANLEYVRLQYANAATTNTVVELYDEPDGTASGDLSDLVERVELTPGDRVELDDSNYPNVQDDLLATTDGNQDGGIYVTVNASRLTG
jgi:hypothetical protein